MIALTDAAAPRKRRPALALLLLVPVPSVGAWLALHGLPGPVGNALFTLAKLYLLAFPLVWTRWVAGERLRIPRPNARGMGAAVVTGSAIFAVIGVAYLLLGERLIEPAALRRAVPPVLQSKAAYLAGAFYWCTVNSLLEEYVWRWFVFTRCEALMPRAAAVVAAAAFFTLHHVIALSAYFGVELVVLGSAGVFVGGAIWSWIYLTSRNVYAAWVSHVFADVVIFAIGYHLLFGG